MNSSTRLVYKSCRNDGTSALKLAEIMWKNKLVNVVVLCFFIYEAGNFWNNPRKYYETDIRKSTRTHFIGVTVWLSLVFDLGRRTSVQQISKIRAQQLLKWSTVAKRRSEFKTVNEQQRHDRDQPHENIRSPTPQLREEGFHFSCVDVNSI